MRISKRAVNDVIAFKSIDSIKLKFHGSSFPRSILVRHIRHAQFPRDLLATFSWGCHEDATRKTASWNLSLTTRSVNAQ